MGQNHTHLLTMQLTFKNHDPCWKYCQTINACGLFHQRTVDGQNIQTLENYIIGMTPPSPHVNVKQLVRGMSGGFDMFDSDDFCPAVSTLGKRKQP